MSHSDQDDDKAPGESDVPDAAVLYMILAMLLICGGMVLASYLHLI